MPLSNPFIPPINGFNLGMADFVSSVSVAAQSPGGTIAVDSTKQDKKIFVLDITSNTIFEYNNSFCTVATMEFSGTTLSLAATGANSIAFKFSQDEKRLYVVNIVTDFVYQYNLPFPGTLRDAFYSGLSLFVGAQTTFPVGVSISGDDSKIYVSSGGASVIYQYDLGDILDVSTGALTGSLDVSAVSVSPIGFTLNERGTKVLVPNAPDRMLFRYDLTTPHTISSGSLSPIQFNGEPYSPPGPFINSVGFTGGTGKNLYIIDPVFDTVYQFISHALKDECG